MFKDRGLSPDFHLPSNIADLNKKIDIPQGKTGIPILDAANKLRDEKDELEKKLQEAEKRNMTDSLTGLPNEEFYKDYVKKYDARKPYDLMVSYFDIANFKETNDTFGHDAGDQKIKEFAGYMNASKREGDIFLRLHGDEFVLLSIPTDEKNENPNFKEGLTKRLDQILEKAEIKFDYATVQFNPNLHQSLNDATNEADRNMLAAKTERKSK